MEIEGDGNPTTPSLHHGASWASTEGVEAAGTGANAAARPESSETASKLSHEGSNSTSAGVGEQELEDALVFMSDLKERLDRSEFVEFVKIMEDFSAGRQSTIKCVESAKELLEDHPELILGLNALLPDEFVAPKAPNYHDALSMVARVKHRFMDNESKYNTFLELISMHRNNQISSNQLWETMKVILVGHQDLLDGFRYFLPSDHPSKTRAFDLKIGHVGETQIDVLLRKVGSAIRKVEKMMRLIQRGEVVKVEDHLAYSDVKFLEELYGNHGLVLDELRENTASTLPVLHACLQAGEEELFKKISQSEEIRSQFYEFLTSCSKKQDP